MNKRIKELASQAGLWFDSELSEFWIANNLELERFAFLVRQELIAVRRQALTDPENQTSQYGTVTVDYMEQQIAAEREACAKLVEGGNHVHPKAPDAVWAKTVAKLVRARGNHEQD
jgi:hypothetical protein